MGFEPGISKVENLNDEGKALTLAISVVGNLCIPTGIQAYSISGVCCFDGARRCTSILESAVLVFAIDRERQQSEALHVVC